MVAFFALLGLYPFFLLFFFFNDTATTEIYTLSLHDALPICSSDSSAAPASGPRRLIWPMCETSRSEEHTSELQSQSNLVCRLLLEKKKKQNKKRSTPQQELDRSNNKHNRHIPQRYRNREQHG